MLPLSLRAPSSGTGRGSGSGSQAARRAGRKRKETEREEDGSISQPADGRGREECAGAEAKVQPLQGLGAVRDLVGGGGGVSKGRKEAQEGHDLSGLP